MRSIGPYQLISHLASGGMADVYLARRTGLEHTVALKTILPERAGDPRCVAMFLEEARLALTLDHHNIVKLYEVDCDDDTFYIAMEYVHGKNAQVIIAENLRRGTTVPLAIAIAIVREAAAGLHHAHERRGSHGEPLDIVHRDVSPPNIVVGYDGCVKLLDFGIAKAAVQMCETQDGYVKGKPGYMSPEQCRAQPVDRRTDVFALGVCLYELTTLRRAFRGTCALTTMHKIVGYRFARPSRVVVGYPAELEAIVLTAMAADPNARFQTAEAFALALDAFAARASLAISSDAVAEYMKGLAARADDPACDAETTTVELASRSPMVCIDDTETAPMPRRRAPLLTLLVAMVIAATLGSLAGRSVAASYSIAYSDQ